MKTHTAILAIAILISVSCSADNNRVAPSSSGRILINADSLNSINIVVERSSSLLDIINEINSKLIPPLEIVYTVSEDEEERDFTNRLYSMPISTNFEGPFEEDLKKYFTGNRKANELLVNLERSKIWYTDIVEFKNLIILVRN